MEETINVRIKLMPGNPPRPATGKVFFAPDRSKGIARALEPGEVVTLPAGEAKEMLERLPYELEMTMDDPTRPVYFGSADEAHLTSQYLNPQTQGRADDQARAVAALREQMAHDKRDELLAREEAIARREAELGLHGPQAAKAAGSPPSLADAMQVMSGAADMLDEEVREPRHNALSPNELEALRKGEEETATAEAQAEPVKRKRRGRPPKNPQPETAA